MKSFVLVVVVALSAFAGAARSNDYWPTSGYSTFYYEDEHGNVMVVSMENGERETTKPGYYMRQIFITDTTGDVQLFFWEGVNTSPGNIRIPYAEFFSPPLQFLPASLEVGQTGIYSTEATDDYGRSFTVWCSWEVTAEETVEVPAGIFDTIVLEIDPGSAGMFSGTYYLSAAVGPVILPDGYQLVSVEGIVPTSQTTWGSLKSLYR